MKDDLVSPAVLLLVSWYVDVVVVSNKLTVLLCWLAWVLYGGASEVGDKGVNFLQGGLKFI